MKQLARLVAELKAEGRIIQARPDGRTRTVKRWRLDETAAEMRARAAIRIAQRSRRQFLEALAKTS